MIEIFDPRFAPVVRASQLVRLCSGAIWSEGPVWLHEDDSVLWSDIPNNRMLRWSEAHGMTVWRDKVEFTNGHTRDLNGDLLHCSHGLRAILRTPVRDGGLFAATPDQTVVRQFEGKRFNSPNDLVVKSDGSIWFTDPPYGILSNYEGYASPSELGDNHVFCYQPDTGDLHVVSSFAEEPNGLAFSPDESLLYVSDTSAALHPTGGGNHHIVVFDVHRHSLLNPRIFAVVSPGLADGFRIDTQGWLYTSSADSVQVYHPDGSLLGKIKVPEKVGNLTFGGHRRDMLYIAASTSLYRIKLQTQGLQKP